MGRKMQEEMLTLEKFEEASEIVKKVTLETKLVYSDYFSAQTGNRVYLKPENLQGHHRCCRQSLQKIRTTVRTLLFPVGQTRTFVQRG